MTLFERHIKAQNFQSPLTVLMVKAAAEFGGDQGALLIKQVIYNETVPMNFAPEAWSALV